MKATPIFFALLLSSFLLQAQPKPDYSNIIENYKAKIEEVVGSETVKGMAIALVDGNEVLWQEGFGYSDFENKIKVDLKTIFGIGSVSKVFTGTAIMQLSEKGELDIDNQYSVYSPEFNIKNRFGDPNNITIRMLLNHHSGLPADIASGVFSLEPKSFRSIIDLVEKEYTVYPPNYIYSYSNIGYSLLGIIVEDVSNQSFEKYIESNIFSPLEMSSACFISDNSPKFSKGYDEKGDFREEYGIRPVPAGAVKSNISDMAKFTRSFLPDYTGNKILNKATINEMLSKQNNNSPLDFNKKYGLTWHFERVNSAGQIFYHTGGTLNHRSLVAIAPESNLGVVILSNSVKSGRFHSIAMNLLDTCAILKNLNLKKEAITPVESKPKVLTNNELEPYSGLYANPMFVLEVERAEDKLTTEIQGNKYLLTPLNDGSFLPQIVLPENQLHTLNDTRIEFERVEKKDLMVFHNIEDGSKQILGSRFKPHKISEIWEKRIGTYVITNKNEADFPFLGSFEIAIVDEVLMLKIMEEYEGAEIWNPAISIKDDNLAFPLGIGRHRGSTLLFEMENGKEVLWYSGYKLMLEEK